MHVHAWRQQRERGCGGGSPDDVDDNESIRDGWRRTLDAMLGTVAPAHPCTRDSVRTAHNAGTRLDRRQRASGRPSLLNLRWGRPSRTLPFNQVRGAYRLIDVPVFGPRVPSLAVIPLCRCSSRSRGAAGSLVGCCAASGYVTGTGAPEFGTRKPASLPRRPGVAARERSLRQRQSTINNASLSCVRPYLERLHDKSSTRIRVELLGKASAAHGRCVRAMVGARELASALRDVRRARRPWELPSRRPLDGRAPSRWVWQLDDLSVAADGISERVCSVYDTGRARARRSGGAT